MSRDNLEKTGDKSGLHGSRRPNPPPGKGSGDHAPLGIISLVIRVSLVGEHISLRILLKKNVNGGCSQVTLAAVISLFYEFTVTHPLRMTWEQLQNTRPQLFLLNVLLRRSTAHSQWKGILFVNVLLLWSIVL